MNGYKPIIEMLQLSSTDLIITNKVRISAVDGNTYEGYIVDNDDGIITIRLNSGELKKFDFRFDE